MPLPQTKRIPADKSILFKLLSSILLLVIHSSSSSLQATSYEVGALAARKKKNIPTKKSNPATRTAIFLVKMIIPAEITFAELLYTMIRKSLDDSLSIVRAADPSFPPRVLSETITNHTRFDVDVFRLMIRRSFLCQLCERPLEVAMLKIKDAAGFYFYLEVSAHSELHLTYEKLEPELLRCVGSLSSFQVPKPWPERKEDIQRFFQNVILRQQPHQTIQFHGLYHE